MVKRILSLLTFPNYVFAAFWIFWIMAMISGQSDKAAIFIVGLALTALDIHRND